MIVWLVVLICLICSINQASSNENCNNTTAIDVHICCKYPDLVDKSITRECFNDFVRINKVNMVTAECILSTCVFSKANISTHGTLKSPRNMKKLLAGQLLRTPQWIRIVYGAIDKCVSESMAREIEIGKIVASRGFMLDGSCNPVFNYCVNCMIIEMLLKCPKQHKIDDPRCDSIIEYYKTCSQQYPSRIQQSFSYITSEKHS